MGGVGVSAYLSLILRRRGGRLFEAGRLLTFSAFRMGAYSRWALIQVWALIRINTVFKWRLDTTPYQWLYLVNVWPHSLVDLPICLQFFQTFVINCYANIPLKVAILRFKGRICKLYNNGTISKHFLGIYLVPPALPLNFKTKRHIWVESKHLGFKPSCAMWVCHEWSPPSFTNVKLIWKWGKLYCLLPLFMFYIKRG